MLRKLVLTSAVSLVLLPGAAGALGLGAIRAQSALNEQFVGDIELTGAKADELDTVKVVVAGPAEFQKAGTARPHFLSNLRFVPQVSPQGRTIVRVTSPEPIREPFLDFLVEVTWPKGRFVKEYTVLLDPPVTVNRPPPRVERPVVAARAESRRESRPGRGSVPGAKAEKRTTAASPTDPLRYGPIKPGANLWRIARSVAPPGATVAQTAMALYRNNPDAFIRGDINRLKRGAVLEIATAAELFALAPDVADREFKSAVRGERATATPLTAVTPPAASDARLQIAGAAPPAAEPPTATPGTEKAEAAPALDTIKQQIFQIQETGESTRQDTAELQGRIRYLEDQLQDIRQTLDLSNQQLAQLSGVQPQVPPTKQPEVTAVEPLQPGTPAVAEPPGEERPAEAQAPTGKPAVPVAQPEPAPQPAFWDSVPLSTIALASGAILLPLLLVWMVVSRRKRLKESLERGTLVQDGPPSVGAASAEEAASEDSETRSPPSSSAYSGFSGLAGETEEADIVSEADVYIAYGRYREAESLLGEEIARSPERFDLKFKLAEAYFGAKNRAGFSALMAEISRAGADRAAPDQWQRLTLMARDLEGAATTAATTEPMSARAGRPTPLAPPPPVVPKAPALAGSVGLGSGLPRLGGDAVSGTASGFPVSVAPQASGFLGLEELEVENLVLPGRSSDFADVDKGSANTGGSDLDLRLEDLDRHPGIDFDFFAEPPRDVQGRKTVPAPRGDEVPGDSVSVARIDQRSQEIASVGKVSFGSDGLSSQWQMDSGLWDEVSTKMDLARAYMEMEDPDAARVILQEVAEEGNEAQRAEAREMLTRLG